MKDEANEKMSAHVCVCVVLEHLQQNEWHTF